MKNEKDTVLIVEDTEENIDILMDALSAEYDISVAMDGETALGIVRQTAPDLILLDIMMPGMDGYEVCSRLKAEKGTRDIPVIFLTALSEDADEEKGLQLGAIDYITKPFNPALVKARVKNQLVLRHAQLDVIRQKDNVEEAYLKLQELEKFRDDLVHMVVHDMRSPLQGISGNLELAMMNADSRVEKYIRSSLKSTNDLSEMVTSLLDISRLESNKMPLDLGKHDMRELAKSVLAKFDSIINYRKVSVNMTTPQTIAYCDAAIMERVIQNLLANALKFTQKDGAIDINLSHEGQWSRISISDNGPGIPKEYHDKVFQKFGQAELKKEIGASSGLGLTFCKLAVEAHGGSIQLESEPGMGATFHVRIPDETVVKEPKAEKYRLRLVREHADKDITVIIVSDKISEAGSLKNYLEKNTNWTVKAVNNPDKTIVSSMYLHPEVVILDEDMPGVTGKEFSDDLKQFPSTNKAVVVLLTGAIKPEDISMTDIKKIGDHTAIAKGMPMASFIETLVDLMEKENPNFQ